MRRTEKIDRNARRRKPASAVGPETPSAAVRPPPGRRARTPSEESECREFMEWMAKYEPVERAILEERDRRAESKRRRALDRRKAFGDLCEITEGLAAYARRNGLTLAEAKKRLHRVRLPHPALALPYMLLTDAWSAACALRRALTRRIDRAKHAAARPAYYAQERARRQALAAERRKVRMRHTISPCPTRMEILDAWTKAKDSPEALLRFGSLMEDLECYVDSSLRLADDGRIVGRRPGIKGWLQLEIPALYMKYKTVMAYKAAAKRMRQVLDMRDPLPLSAALPLEGASQDYVADEIQGRASEERDASDGAPGTASAGSAMGNAREPDRGGARAAVCKTGATKVGDSRAGMCETGELKVGASQAAMCETDELEALRAGAVCAEVMAEVGAGRRKTAALVRRLAELTDPERVEDANMLAGWRERYKRKITVRTKSVWERRLRWTG